MQKMIYIPDSKHDIWDKIEKAAKSDYRGIGFYLCDFWEKKQEEDVDDGK